MEEDIVIAHVDPVIAALRDEELLLSESIDEDEELSQHDIQDDIFIEDIHIDHDQDIENIVETLEEPTTPETSDEIVVSEEIEVIDIDIDGDGIVDETIIIDTVTVASASDLSEAKRQKSIDMLQYELRSLKDKAQSAMYEKKLIEARSLHPERSDFSEMLAAHYYDQAEYKKAL